MNMQQKWMNGIIIKDVPYYCHYDKQIYEIIIMIYDFWSCLVEIMMNSKIPL